MISKRTDLASGYDRKLLKSGNTEVRSDMKTMARTLTVERRILYDMNMGSVRYNRKTSHEC